VVLLPELYSTSGVHDIEDGVAEVRFATGIVLPTPCWII
jgi:hypothetical protein